MLAVPAGVGGGGGGGGGGGSHRHHISLLSPSLWEMARCRMKLSQIHKSDTPTNPMLVFAVSVEQPD